MCRHGIERKSQLGYYRAHHTPSRRCRRHPHARHIPNDIQQRNTRQKSRDCGLDGQEFFLKIRGQ